METNNLGYSLFRGKGILSDAENELGIQKKQKIKKILFLLIAIFSVAILTVGCEDEKDTPFTLLTGPVWVSDSLLVNGIDASGPGQVLANFKGEARFLKDGTGLFANFTGTWRFAQNDTQLILTSPDYPVPITTIIEELSRSNLRISTELPHPLLPGTIMRVRMTFKSRW
mgnify:CR=1 FL=1